MLGTASNVAQLCIMPASRLRNRFFPEYELANKGFLLVKRELDKCGSVSPPVARTPLDECGSLVLPVARTPLDECGSLALPVARTPLDECGSPG